ncbi:MAG: HAMP domain-containing protein, partial [Deltaproteobacteria bacterium]|nr:HAMP domain-containing protein [Deltaproteobacteria bacterium]
MRGIRVQLIAGITIITVAAIALLGFLSIKILEWSALYRKGKEAEVIAMFIQAVAHDDKGFEGNSLKGFISKLSEKVVIKDLAIIDEKGRASFVTGQGLAIGKDDGTNLFFISSLNIKMLGGGWFQGVGKELLVSAPLKQGAGGTIIMTMPLSDIREETANFKKFIFFYAIFDSIIIITFGIYLFSRGIIRPIRRLKETAENIAGGALEQRVAIKAGGEIGSFAVSFNMMADRLEEKIKTLERVNQELVAAQEELVRSEKLATVGRLAAGIAHEIGNPLGALLGYVDILKKIVSSKQEAGSSEEKEILERLGKEIARIDAIVRGLLDFSRPSKKVSQDVDVNKIVKDSAVMLLPQFSDSGISFDMRLDEHIPSVRMDGGMLRQVLLNLFLNSKDAMDGGGTITVTTGEEIETRRVRISVADTGKGIAKEDIGRIFDPF